MDGVCRTYGREERRIQGFGGETLGKQQLGRPRHRWENNIKMDLYHCTLHLDINVYVHQLIN
jgi:hypothetical protein